MINVQNISSKLASLPDQALKQYAEMHKEDPYVFSLALSESNRRKQLRMQTQQPEPQPKVVDKEIADMDMRKALPEDLGIARIPVDMNMAGGGIVAFGDGGMSHYDKGGDIKNAGSDPKLAYRQYALTQANKMGLDPALVDTIFQIESGYNPEAQSPTGPQGIGQLTKNTGKAYGVNPEERKDPYKNIDASIAYMADLNKKYAGDPSKIAVAYNQGEPVLDKHLRANQGQINEPALPKEARGYIKKLTDLLPISAANAEVAPVTAPAPVAPKKSSFRDYLPSFGGDKVSDQSLSDLVTGKPQPAQDKSFLDSARENAEFLMNPPKKSGVAYDPKTFMNPESQAIQPLYPELAVLGAPGRMAAIAKRVLDTKPAASGETTAGLSAIAPKPPTQESPLAIRRDLSTAERERMNMGPKGTSYPVGEEASTMNFLARQRLARQGATKGAAQAEETAAPSAIRQLPPKTGGAANAFRNVQAGQVNLESPNSVAIPQPTPNANEVASPAPVVDDRTKRDPANYKPEEKKQIVAAAKEAVPKTEDTDGWSKNDWLQFGLAMMAGQSPFALSNVGAAGLAVISAKAEKAREQNKLDIYKSVHGEKPGQSIQIAERLMAADPSLSFEDALEKGSLLIGGSTKQDLANAKTAAVAATNLKNFNAAKAQLNKDYPSFMRNNTGPEGKKARDAYESELAALRIEHSIPADTTPTAPAASSIKVLNVRPNP